MFGGGFSGSNSANQTSNATGSSSAGTVFNFGPGSSTGLNQNMMLILAGAAILAIVLFRKK